MNTNFLYILFIAVNLVLIQYTTSCDQRNPVKKTPQQEEIRKIYDADGNLKSQIILKDGKINGDAITYYPGGQISTMVKYVNNKKEGVEKKYYQRGGQLYRTRPFILGKVNGIEKRYYKTGGLKTEQEFRFNNPSIGLIEYSINGRILSDYPKIEFNIIRERDYAEQVLLIFYMSDKSKNVTYYSGKLLKNKYFNIEADPELSKDGVGEIWIEPDFTGSFNISAKVVRESRGLFITQARVRIKKGKIIKIIY